MRIKTRASTRRRGRVASKMPKIKINIKAIKEIKKRKEGVYRRFSKQSKKRR